MKSRSGDVAGYPIMKACSFRRQALRHTGKSVYIRREHHERITRIVQVIGKNQVSLFSYIDQVLTHHFATYQNEIKELYEKYNENIF